MKLIALTAALALAGAANAQNMPAQDTTMPSMDAAQTAQGQTPPADPSTQQTPMQGGMQSQPMQGGMQQQPMASTGETPKGGYMPSAPALSGTPTAGAPVRVQASMSPSQAFPPPAPKAEYPICKRGQTDGCRQRGG